MPGFAPIRAYMPYHHLQNSFKMLGLSDLHNTILGFVCMNSVEFQKKYSQYQNYFGWNHFQINTFRYYRLCDPPLELYKCGVTYFIARTVSVS